MFQSPYLSAANLSRGGCKTKSFSSLDNEMQNSKKLSKDYVPSSKFFGFVDFAKLKLKLKKSQAK